MSATREATREDAREQPRYSIPSSPLISSPIGLCCCTLAPPACFVAGKHKENRKRNTHKSRLLSVSCFFFLVHCFLFLSLSAHIPLMAYVAQGRN